MRSSHLRSEEHTSELQSLAYLVCRLLLEKKKHFIPTTTPSALSFFSNDTATTEIYTLSLHDALPILQVTQHGLKLAIEYLVDAIEAALCLELTTIERIAVNDELRAELLSDALKPLEIGRAHV